VDVGGGQDETDPDSSPANTDDRRTERRECVALLETR
jgi:hypothetical protein